MPIRPENKDRYPANWLEIRNRILTRAGNRCEWCGVENGAPLGDWKVVLTVAHLDHTPENCGDENLAALCQRCHNGYDAPVRAAGIKRRRLEKIEQEQFCLWPRTAFLSDR